MTDKKKRVILDVDVGTDDFLAVLLFLKADELELVKIEAIVCTMGNTTVDNVCRNVVRLLELVNRLDIPVYKGATHQLILPQESIDIFHGQDGLGGLIYDKEPDLSVIRKEPAAVGMAELVRNNPNEISLICVAPLTNAALALRLYDDFGSNLKDMWIMGGNYTAVGNVTATAEYNFYMDPEAAYIVLESTPKPIYILTWETTLLPKISFDWRYNVFGEKQNPAVQLLNRAEKSVYADRTRNDVWLPCDAFLAAAFLNPETIIVRRSVHHASVELHGSQTRGQIVLDHLKKKKTNVTIIEEVDCQKFKELLLAL